MRRRQSRASGNGRRRRAGFRCSPIRWETAPSRGKNVRMSPQFSLLILIPIAYLIGSIPFGLIVGLAKGIDPRKAGSGNIGATNVGRLLGGRYFALVFTLDLLKGLLPTAIASFLLRNNVRTQTEFILWLLVGFAAIAGHMFSLFLKFKGGKGVATSAGVLLGVFPYFTYPGIVAILTWLVL